MSAPNGWHLTVHQAKSVEGMMRRQKVPSRKNDHNIDDDARLRNDTISRGNISRSRVMCGPWSIRLQHKVTILKCKSSRQHIHSNSRTNTAASRTNASYLEDKSKLSWEQMREMRRRNPVGPFLSHQLCQAGPPLPSLYSPSLWWQSCYIFVGHKSRTLIKCEALRKSS